MSQDHAEQFAAWLRMNELFDGVMVIEEPRATSERRLYVVYHPRNPEARQAILDRQQERRTAKAAAEAPGYLFVPDPDGSRFFWCQSASGEVYEVTGFSCTFPDHQYRCGPAGIRCKHQVALAAAADEGRIGTF